MHQNLGVLHNVFWWATINQMSVGLQPRVQGPHVELVIVGCARNNTYNQNCTADLPQRRITTLYPNINGNMIGRSKDTYIAGLHIPIYHKNGVTKYLRTFCLSTQSVSRWTGLKCTIMWHHMQRLNNCYNTKMTKIHNCKIGQRSLAGPQECNVLHTKAHKSRNISRRNENEMRRQRRFRCIPSSPREKSCSHF